jgi:RNA polymerase sigma-70 factor (ECF subfamily)
LENCSDEKLVAGARRGEKSAYAVLVKRHYRGIFAMCLGVLGNVHDAEDMAQEAMLKGFTQINRLRKSEFRPWIMKIAKNLAIDFIRRRKRTREILSEQVRLSGSTSNIEYESLERAIRKLPVEIRLPLVMYYFDGKSAKAIGEKLNISHSGVCQRIRSARKNLHEMLVGQVDENE